MVAVLVKKFESGSSHPNNKPDTGYPVFGRMRNNPPNYNFCMVFNLTDPKKVLKELLLVYLYNRSLCLMTGTAIPCLHQSIKLLILFGSSTFPPLQSALKDMTIGDFKSGNFSSN